jgi:DNA-binding IclR family transcriptional regulator
MIASIQKAMRILSTVSDGGMTPTPLCVIAERTGINKATCSRIIGTLVSDGYLVKISASRGYTLGPAAYCLCCFGRYGGNLISVCHPFMQYLYNTLGHCAVLAVIEGSTKYLIDYIDDGSIFEQKKKIRKDDIYRTATGRAILSHMSRDETLAVWQKYGAPNTEEWPEIKTLNDLLDYRIDANSVVTTRMEHTSGEVSLGYAIAVMRDTRCVGALGIAVKTPKSEEKAFRERDEKSIIKHLMKVAPLISARL